MLASTGPNPRALRCRILCGRHPRFWRRLEREPVTELNRRPLAFKRDWDALKRDVKPIYTAVNAAAARAALDQLAEKWGQRYGAVIRQRENAWNEFILFLDYDIE